MPALDRSASGTHEILNLGTGGGTTVLEMREAVRRITGADLAVEEAGRRAGDPPVLMAFRAHAAEVLGWVPQTEVGRMISDAWAARVHSG